MLVRLLVKVDMFSVFPYYGLAKKKTIFFDIKCHDSYFMIMKCLHNNIAQNDTISMLHVISDIIKNFNSYRRETL